MKKKFKMYVMSFLILLLFNSPKLSLVLAEEKKDENLAFEVETVFPKNQLDSSLSYYFLKVEPDTTYPVSIKVWNRGKKQEQFKVAFNRSYTNSNGLMEYNIHGKKKDSSLKVNIEDLTTPKDKTLTIEPGQSQLAEFQIKTPAESFEGILSGGFYVTKIIPKEIAPKTKNSNMILENRLAYAIPVLVQQQMNYANKPELALKSVKMGLYNKHDALLINIQNPNPDIINQLEMQGRVYKKGSNQTFKLRTTHNMQIAPNSNFTHYIDWEDDELVPGKYRLNLKAHTDKDKWEWNKDFTVSKKDVEQFKNERVNFKQQKTVNPWIVLVIGLLLGLILIMVIIIIKKYIDNQKKQARKKKKHKSKK